MSNFNLTEFAADCQVPDVAGFLAGCEAIRELLVLRNQEYNLSRITEKEEFDIKHVADSLLLARFFPEIATKKLNIADIGCGAGFPSLVLAAAFPNLKITAIDSTGKKVKFVAEVAAALGLSNLNAVHGRSTELNRQKEYTRRFDIVTARAVAASPIIFLDSCNFAKPGGRFLFYKTPAQAQEELPALNVCSKKIPTHWEVTGEYELPDNAGKRVFIIGKRP